MKSIDAYSDSCLTKQLLINTVQVPWLMDIAKARYSPFLFHLGGTQLLGLELILLDLAIQRGPFLFHLGGTQLLGLELILLDLAIQRGPF